MKKYKIIFIIIFVVAAIIIYFVNNMVVDTKETPLSLKQTKKSNDHKQNQEVLKSKTLLDERIKHLDELLAKTDKELLNLEKSTLGKHKTQQIQSSNKILILEHKISGTKKMIESKNQQLK